MKNSYKKLAYHVVDAMKYDTSEGKREEVSGSGGSDFAARGWC